MSFLFLSAPKNPVWKTILVIGFGNTLRGDDSVGYQVAETIAEWQIPQVRSIALQQLLPELAADVAAADRVIFVDAVVTKDLPALEIAITPLVIDNSVSGGDENFSTHIITPLLLLGMAQRLYGAVPIAYLLTIPGIDFSLGTTLSPIAQAGKNLALDCLNRWLQDPTAELCMKSVS